MTRRPIPTPVILCFFLLVLLAAAATAAYKLPQVTVSKSPTKPKIEKSEWSTVKIVVTGDTQQQTQPFPVAVVLAIDYSGSMGTNDPNLNVSVAAKQVVGLLKPAVDKLGIITIQTNATWAVPLAQLTSANVAAINQKIDGFSPGGYTNYKDAFDMANAALKADASANKIVIFMSDGFPEPDTIKQQNHIYSKRFEPAAAGIRYFTIEFGPSGALPSATLKLMADSSGGTYQKATSAAALVPTFKKALDEGQMKLSARKVVVEEALASGLKIRPDSLSWSPAPATNDVPAFEAAMKAIKTTFHQTRKLKTPAINLLPASHNFTLTFDVTIDSCGDEEKSYPIDAAYPSSRVTYLAGGKASSLPIPVQQLTVQRCDLHLEKDFDPKTKTVTLTVRNDYPRPVTQVLVHEVTSEHFVPAVPTSPSYDKLDPVHRHVWWGDIQNNKIELASNEKREYTFILETAPGSATKKGPLDIDWVRAGVTYTVDAQFFVVDSGEAGYSSFESDLTSGSVSAATATALKKWFADKPDPDVAGKKLGMSFDVPTGQQFMSILIPIGQPAPEFAWILPATSGGRLIKIKKTAKQIAVYSPSLKWKRFPQKQTPAGYTP